MYTAIDVVEKFSIYHSSWIIHFIDANNCGAVIDKMGMIWWEQRNKLFQPT